MSEQAFVIVRDARGSLVHVRRRDTGECTGCIEVGLFETMRIVIVAEIRSEEAVAFGDRLGGDER